MRIMDILLLALRKDVPSHIKLLKPMSGKIVCVETCSFAQQHYFLYFRICIVVILFYVSRLLIGGLAGLAAIAILMVVIVTTCSVAVFRWKRRSRGLNPINQTQGTIK